MRFTVSLTENHLFRALYTRGKRADGAYMIVYALPTPRRKSRLPRPRRPDDGSRPREAEGGSQPRLPRPREADNGSRPCRPEGGSRPRRPCRPCRLGFTVSKKLGGAVRRNRCRRRLKEAYRLCEGYAKPGYDVVIVARGRAYDAPFDAILREMKVLLGRVLGKTGTS